MGADLVARIAEGQHCAHKSLGTRCLRIPCLDAVAYASSTAVLNRPALCSVGTRKHVHAAACTAAPGAGRTWDQQI